MQLRWTDEAANDLLQIADYLFEQTPFHAQRLILRIFEAPETLKQFPFRGRIGRKAGTRELVIPSLPYIIVYAVSTDAIHIVRILHGAHRYP